MKKLLTATLLNLALISGGNYSSLRSAPQELTPRQEALQELQKHVKGNIEKLVRCGTEEEQLKYEARKATLDRALIQTENEHLEEFYLTESDSTLVLSKNNQLYEVKYMQGMVNSSEDLTQTCVVYLLRDKLKKEREENKSTNVKSVKRLPLMILCTAAGKYSKPNGKKLLRKRRLEEIYNGI